LEGFAFLYSIRVQTINHTGNMFENNSLCIF